MSDAPKWKQSEDWRRRGDGFLVEVNHYTDPPSEHSSDRDKGPHRWCVYAWIYPSHPHFAKFKGSKSYQPAASEMPFHGGCSFLRRHRGNDKNTKVTAIQIGADYNHVHDMSFTFYETPERARKVFADAEVLFDWLAAMVPAKVTIAIPDTKEETAANE